MEKSKGKFIQALGETLGQEIQNQEGLFSLLVSCLFVSWSDSFLLFRQPASVSFRIHVPYGSRHSPPHASSVLMSHDKGRNKLEYC